MIRQLLALVLFAAAALLACQSGEAGSKRSDGKVKVEAKAGKADGGKQTIAVTIDIDKGWHVYANPVKHPMFEEAATVVEIRAGGKKVDAKVKYPAGTERTEKGVGKLQIYEGQVVIEAVVEGGTGPYEVSVRVNACDEGKCLPSGTVKVQVP